MLTNIKRTVITTEATKIILNGEDIITLLNKNGYQIPTNADVEFETRDEFIPIDSSDPIIIRYSTIEETHE